MNTSISNPDAAPPSAPGTLSASGGLSSASLSWGAATDNVGVVRYNVHRGTSAGFTPSLANRVAQPAGRATPIPVCGGQSTSTGSRLRTRPGMSARSRTRRRRRSGTRRRPRRRGPWRRSGRSGGRPCPGAAATDNVGVVRYNVHRGTSAGFTPAGGEPDRAADLDRLHRQHQPRAPTSTRSPPRTRPATSAPPRTRRARP